MKKDYQELHQLLKKGIVPATGCTEPVAVAYAVATAREKTEGNLESMQIQVDSNIYKNGLMVTIPGTKEKGLMTAAALGYVAGDPNRNFRVIGNLTDEDIKKAKKLIAKGKIELNLNPVFQGLHIEVILVTDQDKIRVIILDSHLNVVSVQKVKKEHEFLPFKPTDKKETVLKHKIQNYSLEDFLQFSKELPLEDLIFLEKGITMNLEIAQEGMAIKSGVAAAFENLIKQGLMCDDIVSRAQILCAAASQARMSGSRLPVMSTAGSGNHGITAFLTNYAVAEKRKFSKEKLIRSLALTHLITLFIKSYTGTLSAMCGCGVAAGIGASAGVVYLLGGNENQVLGALYNMVGSISGVICDGAKEGCSYKLALASGWAVQSALLALRGAVIHNTDGIVDPDFRQLIKNLGYICDSGMVGTDKAILDVMLGKKKKMN